MKKGKNTDVIVSPRSGILNKKKASQERRSHGEHSDREPKVRMQEEVTPNEIYNKKHSKAPLFNKKRTSSTKVSGKSSPKMAYAMSTIRFNRQAEPVMTKPKTRSKSGTLLEFVRNQHQNNEQNPDDKELMETGIIIKTPDDRKKMTKNRTEDKQEEEQQMNNINIMIYEGPPRDASKLRK